jgi:CRP-like cAMP-binding protein
VIGFALQGVLGNLLAGMSLHISGSAMPGDWINIGDAEGRVMQTNWRETRLRSVDGHMLIVPNSKVAAAVMHNMVRPTPLRRHKIDVGASYSDPPDDVYAALLAAAQEMPEVQKHPAPEVIVTAFEDYGINYQLRYWTNRYPQRRSIDGRVRRLIWYKFKRAGIEIPFPMSDKLLNDFMQVIYHQRKLRAEDDELSQRVADLMVSKLHNEICVNEQNQPLLARENWERIVERVDRQLYTQDETLYRQGEAGDSFHVIVSGTLKVSVAHEGDKPALEFNLESGDVVGEMSLITGLPRSATIHTATGCELLEFDRGDFRELLALHEQIPDALANLAEQREDANRTAFEALPPESQQQVVIDKAGILNRLRRMIGM